MQHSPNKKSNGILPNKYEASYVFNECLDHIWHFVSDIKCIETIFTGTHITDALSESPLLTKFKFTVGEISTIECNQKIIWLVQGLSSPTQLSCSFSLVANTLDNTTLLTLSLVLKHPNHSEDQRERIIQGSQTLVKELIINIETLLTKCSSSNYDYQSIEIKCPIEFIWNYVTKFAYLEEVEYIKEIKFEGNTEKVGGKISWREVREGKEEKTTCIISRYNKNPMRKKWTFGIIPQEGPLKHQEAKFVFIFIDEEVTFFSFFHKFKEAIDNEQLYYLKAKKKMELAQLKDLLECKFSNINGNLRNFMEKDILNK